MVGKCLIMTLYTWRENWVLFLFVAPPQFSFSQNFSFLPSPEIQHFRICHDNQRRAWLCGSIICIVPEMI